MRFDPILFDLDGTLVDSSKDIAVSVNFTLEELGLAPLAEEEIVGFVGDGVRWLMRRALSRVGSTEVDQAVRRFKEFYAGQCLVHTQPYPGIAALLSDLGQHGAAIGVVTNKPVAFARAILDGLGLAAHLACVVGGDETRNLKPAPDPLLLACQRLGRPPEPGIMIGDSTNDIAAGKAAAMTTCKIHWGFATKREDPLGERPDFKCKTVEELSALLL